MTDLSPMTTALTGSIRSAFEEMKPEMRVSAPVLVKLAYFGGAWSWLIGLVPRLLSVVGGAIAIWLLDQRLGDLIAWVQLLARNAPASVWRAMGKPSMVASPDIVVSYTLVKSGAQRMIRDATGATVATFSDDSLAQPIADLLNSGFRLS